MGRLRLSLAALLAALILAAPASAASTTLVVNEIDYDQPGTDTAEFLELGNVSTAPVNLDRYVLQLVNGANNSVYLTVDLPVVELAPGAHYVVCGNPAVVTECDLDVGATQDLIQNGPPDAAAILDGATVVDAVSYEGQVPGFSEGAAAAPTDAGAAAPAPAQSTARVPDGCDTDQNGTDFAVATSTPGASNGEPACSGPPGDAAPTVASTDPAGGAFGVDPAASIAVTFSEPVTAAAGAFALACTDGRSYTVAASSGDQTTYTVDPAERLPRGERCTLTVRGASVADTDAQDPPDTMAADATVSFFVAGLQGLRIHDIQGASHRSPYDGRTVAGVPGVVTAVSSGGFWMQDARPDRDRRTSEGVFVFRGGRPAIGTPVVVDGLVEEFRPGADPLNLTTTEISSPVVTPAGTGTVARHAARQGRAPAAAAVHRQRLDRRRGAEPGLRPVAGRHRLPREPGGHARGDPQAGRRRADERVRRAARGGRRGGVPAQRARRRARRSEGLQPGAVHRSTT